LYHALATARGKPICGRLKANTDAIESLTETVNSTLGYAKEIDHLMTGMKVIENHVGI
jgi:hypothetical protein